MHQEMSSAAHHEPYGVGICIAGGACPATSLVGHEVIQTNRRYGNDVYVLHGGLNSLLHGTTPERVQRHRESYVDLLLGEASRDFVGPENAPHAAKNMAKLRRDYNIRILYVVGGDGTAAGLNSTLEAYQGEDKPSVYLAPKTIDGDVLHSDTAVGHATAVFKVDEMMNAARHDSFKMKRALFVQVPGRDAGHLALRGGEGHADVILIKEAPFTVDTVAHNVLRIYEQQRYAVIAVAEGFEPVGINRDDYKYTDSQGNNGRIVIADYLAGETRKYMQPVLDAMGIPASHKPVNSMVIPSELLRGARPVQEDRDLATDLGIRMSEHGHRQIGTHEALAFVVQEDGIVPIPLQDIAQGYKKVSEQDYWPGGMYINHHKQPLI